MTRAVAVLACGHERWVPVDWDGVSVAVSRVRGRVVSIQDARTGWQEDGTYVPCDECGWEPEKPRHAPPGVPLHMPGTTHHADCPLVPRLSPEVEAKLRAQLADNDRARRDAMRDAHNYWVG